jgi:hypothetical protein
MNQLVKSKPKKSSKTNRIVRMLHVYTSMLMLLIMLFFTLTGITLNHRDWFTSTNKPQQIEITIPDSFTPVSLWETEPMAQGFQLLKWLQNDYSVYGTQVSYEWEPEEGLMMIDIKQPGGYSIVEVDVNDGIVFLEQQNYGLVATFNDLHMGRYSGDLWSAFIDIFALAMLLFTLTGFWLVIPQKKKRKKLLSLTVMGSGIFLGAYLGAIWL